MGVVQRITVGRGVEVLATYPDGSPAIVLVRRGRGKLYYVAAALSPKTFSVFMDMLIEATGLNRPIRIVGERGHNAWGVEGRAVRRNEGQFVVYLTNYTQNRLRVRISTREKIERVYDLRAAAQHKGLAVTLSPRETRLLLLSVAKAR